MKGKLVAQAYREGLIPLLTKQETELSALQVIVKMATRQSLEEKKHGKTIYAFAHYEKLKRATIPLIDDPRSDYVLLVSFDLNAEHESIILHKILPLVRRDRTNRIDDEFDTHHHHHHLSNFAKNTFTALTYLSKIKPL